MTSHRIEIVNRVNPLGAAQLLLLLLVLPSCAARPVSGFVARLGPNALALSAILNREGVRPSPPSDFVFADFVAITDPPGARVLVNGDSVGNAPVQVHHSRASTYGVLNRMVVRALPQAAALCAQTRVFGYSVAVTDTVRLDLHRCPTQDEDLSRVFIEDEVEPPPELLSPGTTTYRRRSLASGPTDGSVAFEIVIDSSGRAEPRSFVLLNATDDRFVATVRALALTSTFRPGRILGRPVRVRTSLMAYFVVIR